MYLNLIRFEIPNLNKVQVSDSGHVDRQVAVCSLVSVTSTNSVVVTYKISILVPRVQFPVGAFFIFGGLDVVK